MARGGGCERGAVLVWTVLGLVAVGALMALSINVGRAHSVRGGLQNGADAGALAGAAELTGQLPGLAAAEAAAVAVAGRHATDGGHAVAVTPGSDVVLGTWDRDARLFRRVDGRSAADLRLLNAVQVRAGREAARGNAMPVAFGGAFLERRTLDVRTAAVAVGGGPCRDQCAFPVAFADCQLVDPSGALRCDGRLFTLNSDWQDNLGLTSLVPGQPASVPNVKDALSRCTDSSADASIPVTNGNPMQPIASDPAFRGVPLQVSAPVVHVEGCFDPHYERCQATGRTGECLNAKFVGQLEVAGYVTIKVCYATGATVKKWPPADWPSHDPDCGAPPTQADFPGVSASQWPDPFLKQTLFMRHLCDVEQPADRAGVGGCGFFGTYTRRSRLVE